MNENEQGKRNNACRLCGTFRNKEMKMMEKKGK